MFSATAIRDGSERHLPSRRDGQWLAITTSLSPVSVSSSTTSKMSRVA